MYGTILVLTCFTNDNYRFLLQNHYFSGTLTDIKGDQKYWFMTKHFNNEIKSSDAKAYKYIKWAFLSRFLCKYWYFWMGWGWDLVHLKRKYLMNTIVCGEHSLGIGISFLTKMAFRGFCIEILQMWRYKVSAWQQWYMHLYIIMHCFDLFCWLS